VANQGTAQLQGFGHLDSIFICNGAQMKHVQRRCKLAEKEAVPVSVLVKMPAVKVRSVGQAKTIETLGSGNLYL